MSEHDCVTKLGGEARKKKNTSWHMSAWACPGVYAALGVFGWGVGVSSGLPCWLWLWPMQFDFVQVLIVCCILLCAEFAVHHLSIKTLFEKN